MTFRLMAGALVTALLLAGCAVGRGSVVARNLDGPVSMSGAYVDSKGVVILPASDQVVHRFDHSWRHWSTLLGIIPLSTVHCDVSELLNNELRDYDGSAIVNLTINTKFGVFQSFSPLLIGLYVEVEGDVVKVPQT